MLKQIPLLLPLCLMACGGSSNSDFPVQLEPDVTASIVDDTLSVVVDGNTIEVSVGENTESGGFRQGQNFGDVYSMAARFESEAATATIATQIVDENFASVTSFERLIAVETPLTGSATAEGTVISAFTPEPNDIPTVGFEPSGPFPSQVDETIVMNVNFDDMLIDGRITAGTFDLFGLGLEFTLDEEINTIDLLETQIGSDGAFDGVARYANNSETADGTYGGLIAGEGGNTIVGAFDVPGRIGVFQATVE